MTTLTADTPQPRASTSGVDTQDRAGPDGRGAAVLGGLSVVIGLVVIVGWWFQVDAVSSLVPGAPPMVANTALMGVLAGIALVLLSPRQRARGRTLAGLGFATATFVVGAVTLLEYLVAAEATGFDLLVARRQEHPGVVRYPGRPSPHTAVSFMCVGVALVLLDVRKRRFKLRPSELMLVPGMALPTAALLGYIFDVEGIYGVPGLMPYTGMAINTAVALLMLGAGALLARPDEGLMAVVTSEAPGGLVARRMLLGLASLLALGLAVSIGVVLDLYNAGIAASVVVLGGFVATAAFMLTTAVQLNRAHAEAHVGREERARLAALIESSDDGINLIKPDGTIVHWNPACETIYGYRADEMVGRSIFELIPASLVEEHEARLAALLRGERVETHETVRKRKDGSLVPLSLTLSAVGGGEDKRPIGISTVVRDISERRAAEEALRASEANFRSLFELAGDGIFVASPDGLLADVNDAACQLLGCSHDQLVGTPVVDLILPEDVERLRQSRQVMGNGRPYIAEWTLVGCQQERIAVEVSTRVLPDGRWLGFVRDIRERLAAARAVADAHAREHKLRRELERVLDAGSVVSEATAALSSTSLHDVLVAIASEAQKLTGAEYAAVGIDASSDAPFGQWAFVGIDEETARRIGRLPRAVGTLGLPARTHRAMRTRDVREHPAFRGFPPHHPEMTSLLGVPIRYGSAPVGNLYLANKRDAPEFTDADERIVTLLGDRLGSAIETARLYDSEALQRIWLQAIFDHMPEGVIILDAHGGLRQQNPAACKLAAPLPGDEVPASKPGHEFLDPEGRPLPSHEQPGRRALRGESVSGRELTVRDRDGKLRTALVSATPVHTPRGPAGAVVVFQDITPLKELERLREEWASVVAHDLRQPVAAIDLGAQALLHMPEASVDPDAQMILERIRASARRLTRMITDLLDASRIEAQHLSLVRAPTNLGQLVRECVDEMAERLADHRVELDLEPGVLVELDPDRMRQVMNNLLSNAAKYGTEGTPVRLTLRDGDSTVELAVTNHGPGIEPDELPRLFERFERTRGGKASGRHGLGLGLYITRGLVEAHGGHIRAESTPGEQTTFIVTLPRHTAHGTGQRSSMPVSTGQRDTRAP